MKQGTDLVAIEDIERARDTIRTCRNVDEVLEIRDKAKAVATYHRARGAAHDLVVDASEMVLRAEVRLGEFLKEAVKRGRPKATKVNNGDHFSLSDLGVTKNDSSRWQKAASLPEGLVDEYVRQVREAGATPATSELVDLSKLTHEQAAGVVARFAAGEAPTLRAALRAQSHDQRTADLKRISEANQPLDGIGTFPVIYADPSWRYKDGTASPSRKIENQYPTMSIEDIEALPVDGVGFADAALFMWIPGPLFIPYGERVLNAWGFGGGYKTNLIWDKEKLGMGYWGRIQHEHLIIATRGKMVLPPSASLERSVYREKSGEHSAKPAHFRDMITEMYPTLRKLEMFARGEAPKGWTYWGNQAGEGDP